LLTKEDGIIQIYPMGRVDLSFVIPVRNDAAALARCLDSIALASQGAAVEVIVIDNGSSDSSAEIATRAGARTLVVPNERVGALRNRGTALARGPLLAFVDADHQIGRSWVEAALDAMSDLDVAAVGSPCVPPPNGSWVQRAYDGFRDHTPGRHVVTWLGSGNLVVRTDVFRRIGGFDESLEACEDVDLCRRIRAVGGLLMSDSRLESIHYGDPSSLRALFRGESWRGRNNLQVSLRESPTLRGLPSLVIPVVDLGLLSLLGVTLFTARFQLAAASAAAFALPAIARALQVRRRTRVALSHAIAVAVVYDVARAVAILLRMPHRRLHPQPVA
jgi:GT2 family glycosyltransferase